MPQSDGFSGIYTGLNEEEAENNLKMYGFNTDNKLEEDGKGFEIMRVFINPRFLLMILAAVVMFVSSQIVGGAIMTVLIFLYVFLEIYKGVKTDAVMFGISSSFTMKVRTIRNGEIVLVEKERLVPDDIIVLQGGENVPADAHLLEINNITVDESLFTGDSTPVRKFLGSDAKNEVKQSCIYKGTKIIDGNLVAKISATGVDTKKYKNFGAAVDSDSYYTDFEHAINKLMPVFSVISLVMLLLSALFSFVSLDESTTNIVMDLLTKVLLPSVAFALCMIPSETASLVRIYYVNGACRLASKHSVVRNLRVLESINSVTAICIDKTGTITATHAEVCEEYGKDIPMLLNIAVLACDIKPNSSIDQAIMLDAAFKQVDAKELVKNELINAYPFDDNHKIAGNLWRIEDSRLLCIKGSPENVLSLCDMKQQALYNVQKKQAALSKAGNQVIAVAVAILPDERETPQTVQEERFTFIGLLALTNKTRDTIPFAIKSCYRAGVKVIMTTGDSVDTAVAIAKQIGLKEGRAVTGEMLRRAEEYGETLDLSDVNIFARITPQQKLDIIHQLRTNGEIVAITGEEAGESELLRQADVGVTTSQRASGATIEACDLLMNDDNFNMVVETIKESRQVHKNVKNCISIVLSAQICIWIFSLINLLSGRELLLSPVVLSLLTILIIPMCSLIFIHNTSDMKGQLVSSGFIGRGEINKGFFAHSVIQGTAIALFSLIIFFVSPTDAGMNGSTFLMIFVSGIIASAWENTLGNRQLHNLWKVRNNPAILLTAIMLVFTMLLIYVPYVNTALGLAAINPFVLILCFILGLCSLIFTEIYKKIKGEVTEQ